MIKKICLTILLSAGVFFAKKYSFTAHQASSPLQSLRPLEGDELVFFALGDTGTGAEDQKRVAQAMENRCQKEPNFSGTFLLGDNFYFDGVKTLDDEQWKSKVIEPYLDAPCLGKQTLFGILGNHDYKGDTQTQIDFSQKDSRWYMPYRFYSVDFGDLLRVVVFDSTFPDLCFDPTSCSLSFLRKALSTSTAQWTIATDHYPAVSSSALGGNYSGQSFIGQVLRKILCGNAHALISAHAHHLEHAALESCSTDFFISGGGGGELKDVDGHLGSMQKFAQSHFGFLEIRVRKESLAMSFVSDSGEVLYQHVNKAKI